MRDILLLCGLTVNRTFSILSTGVYFQTTRTVIVLMSSYFLDFISYLHWIFVVVVDTGFFCGGYHYSLRVYLFERVRARNFSQAWSFVQCSQSISIVVGVNLAEFLNCHVSHKSGYLFGFFCALSGSLLLFLVDVHKRSILSHRHTR